MVKIAKTYGAGRLLTLIAAFALTCCCAGTAFAAPAAEQPELATATRQAQLQAQETPEITDACIAPVPVQQYEGVPLKPKPTVTVDSVVLVAGQDYELSWEDNVEGDDEGMATLTVTGIGAFGGVAHARFKIAYVSVYAQAGDDGQRTLAHAFSKRELEALKSDSGSPVSALYGDHSGASMKVCTTTSYVTLDDLALAAERESGLAFGFDDPLTGVRVVADETFAPAAVPLREDIDACRYFFASIGRTGSWDVLDARLAPPVLALTAKSAGFGEVASAYSTRDLEDYLVGAQSPEECPRFVYGISEEQLRDGTARGNRLTKYVHAITFITHKGRLERVANVPARAYTGAAIEPALSVTASDGATLMAGRDYEVSYADNVEVGTATATVTGKGQYVGRLSAPFVIYENESSKPVSSADPAPADANDRPESGKAGADASGSAKPKSISGAVVKLSKAKLVYNGKVQRVKPCVELGGKTLRANVDYAVSGAQAKKPGAYTVTISGKGAYAGACKATFKVAKAAQKLKAHAKAVKVKHASLTKKARTFNAVKLAGVRGAKTKLAFTGTAKLGKKSAKKHVSVSKAGVVKLKRGAPAGTYKLKLVVRAKANAFYKAAKPKSVTLTFKVE